MEKNIMMVLLGYFFIAAISGVAASAMIGLVLTNLLIDRLEKADRPIRISSESEVNSQPGRAASRSRLPFGFRNSIRSQRMR
jgi:hypothetical protein